MKVNSIGNSNQISKITEREKPKEKFQPILPYYIMNNHMYSSHYNSPKNPHTLIHKKNNINNLKDININTKNNNKKFVKSNSTLSSYNYFNYNNYSKQNLNNKKFLKNEINLNSVENSPTIKDKILSHSKNNFKTGNTKKNKKKINFDCNLLIKKIYNPNKQKSSHDLFYNDNKNCYTLNSSDVRKKNLKMVMTSLNNSKNSSHEKIKINSKKKLHKFNYIIYNNKKNGQGNTNSKLSLNNSAKSIISKNINSNNNAINYIYNNKIGKIYKKNHGKFLNNELFHPDSKRQGMNFFMNYLKGVNNVISNGNSCRSINSTVNISYKKPKIRMGINELKKELINKEHNYNNISKPSSNNKKIINSSIKASKCNQYQQTTARSLSINNKNDNPSFGVSNMYNFNLSKNSKKNSSNKTKLNLKKYLVQNQKDSPIYKYFHKTTANYFNINNNINNNYYYKTIKSSYNSKNNNNLFNIINIPKDKQNINNDSNKYIDDNYNSKINKILKDSLQEISKIKNDFAKHFTANNSPNQKNNLQNKKDLDNNNNNFNNNNRIYISKNISLINNHSNNNNKNLFKKKRKILKNTSIKKNSYSKKKIKESPKKNNINMKIKKQNIKQLTQNNSKTNIKKIFEPKIQNDQLKNISLTNQYNQTLTHSSRSCIHDSYYYLRESQKLSKYIKNYYAQNKKYPETNLNFYKYGRLIGQGAFGKVNLGLNILTGRVVAIKSFNKSNLNSNSENMKKILYETNLMKKLNHPNITKILELFEDKEYILIIMEYINGGNLFSFLKKRRKVSEKTAKFLYRQIILGLKYIHSHNIVHRDIKLENILIDLNNNIKICDFGIGRVLSSPEQLLFDQCGTPMYIAPEILLSSKDNGYKGFPVDIWSSGIALYILLSGSLPFNFKNGKSVSIEESENNENNNNSEELQFSIINSEPKYIENISDEARDLLKGLLNKNPEKRLNCDEILAHPWLKDINKNLDNNKYHLFTKAEIKMLSKTYVDYRKDKNDNLKENFTLSNLYIDDKNKNNDNEKNNETKSSILAPFNSVNNDNDEDNDDFYFDDINMDDFNNKNIQLENGIISIGNKVKEFNMFYEMNNNCEVDNGIIINTKTNTITSTSNNNTINSLTDSFIDKGDSLYKMQKEKEKENKNKKIKNFSNKGSTKIKKIIKEYTNSNNDENINDINNILNQLETLGYNRNYVKECVKNNVLCHASTAYFLMLNYDKI